MASKDFIVKHGLSVGADVQVTGTVHATTFVGDGSALSGVASGTTYSATPPVDPASGALWLDSVSGALYVFVIDQDSGQWIQPSAPTPDVSQFVTTLDLASSVSTILATKTTSDLTEGTNLYFTQARARGAISAGSNVTYSDGVISITSSNVTGALGYTPYNSTNPSGYTTNTGTVTSVAGTGTVSGLSLSGSVTTSGNLTLGGTLSVTPSNFASQVPNTVLAAPNGSSGTPTFRTLVTADIPNLDASKITSGTIDALRLPSYVDDVIEGANLASFPAVGETGKIYVALDTNKTYRWSGSVYVYITSGAVDSVGGFTGVVTANNLLSSLLTVDGAGSTLDADTLDGYHASAFYLATNPSGYTTNTGTVTSVSGTGTVNGLTLTGSVTTTGSLTLGGTLNLSSPPAIGSTTANTGAFTTLSASGAAGIGGILTVGSGTTPYTAPLFVNRVVSNIASGSVETSAVAMFGSGVNNGDISVFIGADQGTTKYGYIGAVAKSTSYVPLVLQPSGGSVGIGIKNPSTIAHIYATSQATLRVETGTSANNADTRYVSPQRSWSVGQNIYGSSGLFEISDVTAGVNRITIDASGNVVPGADVTQNLGSTTNRWANIYTGDLHLSNETKGGNDVDGTTGNWTLQEGAEDLFIINNKTGKKYKFSLQEIV